MKRAFFIALAIYLVAGAIFWQIEWPKIKKSETKRISLASITIKKSKCECRKCSCGVKKRIQKEVKPFEPPKKELKPIVAKEPKKPEPKKKRKKVVKPKKKILKSKPKKRRKIFKKTKKKVKVAQKKRSVKPLKKEVKHLVKQERTLETKTGATSSKVAASKPKPVPPAVQPSYQQRYLNKFANEIRKAIQRHKFYPRIARKTKKEGVVELYFELTPKKKLRNIKVVRSSGHAILDRAAIKCVEKASKEFPAPKECVKVSVPIEYRLR
jgi:protein TonB